MLPKPNLSTAVSISRVALPASYLVLFFAFAWWRRIYNLDLWIAWNGFTPVGYVYKLCQPGNFAKDFPGGAEIYDESAFMHVYKIAYAYFGISPESLLPIVIAFEFAIMALAMYALSRTLLREASPIVPVLVVMLASASWARDMNLARFGAPFFWGLPYNVADALRVFAIVTALKGRLAMSGLLLGASFASHPIMGLIGTVFVLGMIATKPRELLRGPAVMGYGAFLVLAGTWMFRHADSTAPFWSGIPHEEWFRLTKLMSSHWYPVTSGVFTTEHTREFMPFLSFLLLLVFYIGRAVPLRENDRKIISGLAAVGTLTVIGVINSAWAPHPTAVKLALHRSNDLIVLVGLVYVTNGLWSELDTGRVWRRVVATLILVSPFVSHPGYPVLLSLLLTGPAWLSVLRRQDGATDVPTTVTSFLIVTLIFAYVVVGIAAPWSSDAYTGGMFFSRLIHPSGWSITLPILALFLFMSLSARKGVPQVVCLSLVVASGVFWVQDQQMGGEEVVRDRDYKAAQLWAKKHTGGDRLFMTDPGVFYGWRDYSQRASFGNLREWLYSGWAYTSNAKVYEEGLKRFKEFSINVDQYANRGIWGFGPLVDEVQRRYYELGDDWRLDLARRYGIDYFVFAKDRMTRTTGLRLVYENGHFAILSAHQVHGQVRLDVDGK